MLASKDSLMSEVMAPSSTFNNATQEGKDLSLFIDHNETLCLSKLNATQCYYLIIVSGNRFQNASQFSKFKITATHNQINHQILQESNLLTDSVDMN